MSQYRSASDDCYQGKIQSKPAEIIWASPSDPIMTPVNSILKQSCESAQSKAWPQLMSCVELAALKLHKFLGFPIIFKALV